MLPNGTNRYFSGHYKTAAEAKIARDKIRAKGVKEAYVLSFENGEETAVDDTQLQSVSSNSAVKVDAEIGKQEIAADKDTSLVIPEEGNGLDVNESVLTPRQKRYGLAFLLVIALLSTLGIRRLLKSKS